MKHCFSISSTGYLENIFFMKVKVHLPPEELLQKFVDAEEI